MLRVEPDSEAPSNRSPLRRRLATVVALVGVAVIGGQLARAWPREVEVAYRTTRAAQRLDVDIVLDEEAVASVRFRRPPGFEGLFVHKVTLQPGEYEARITVYREDGRGIEHRRVLFVPSDGQTRFDLRE